MFIELTIQTTVLHFTQSLGPWHLAKHVKRKLESPGHRLYTVSSLISIFCYLSSPSFSSRGVASNATPPQTPSFNNLDGDGWIRTRETSCFMFPMFSFTRFHQDMTMSSIISSLPPSLFAMQQRQCNVLLEFSNLHDTLPCSYTVSCAGSTYLQCNTYQEEVVLLVLDTSEHSFPDLSKTIAGQTLLVW